MYDREGRTISMLSLLYFSDRGSGMNFTHVAYATDWRLSRFLFLLFPNTPFHFTSLHATLSNFLFAHLHRILFSVYFSVRISMVADHVSKVSTRRLRRSLYFASLACSPPLVTLRTHSALRRRHSHPISHLNTHRRGLIVESC